MTMTNRSEFSRLAAGILIGATAAAFIVPTLDSPEPDAATEPEVITVTETVTETVEVVEHVVSYELTEECSYLVMRADTFIDNVHAVSAAEGSLWRVIGDAKSAVLRSDNAGLSMVQMELRNVEDTLIGPFADAGTLLNEYETIEQNCYDSIGEA